MAEGNEMFQSTAEEVTKFRDQVKYTRLSCFCCLSKA